jgi:Flp pilus assembly protein TadD
MPDHHTADPKPTVHVLVFVLLLLTVSAAYINSLGNRFTFDDETIVEKNPLIKQVHHLPLLITRDYWAGARDPNAPRGNRRLYRPLVLLSYAANYAVGGVTPWGYHLVNVLLHFGVAWLMYVLALQLSMSVPASAIAAVLFAVHPIHTEAVSGVVGRAELMMALGVLASLWCAVRGRLRLSLLAFAFGLLSKEQAVMLPLLLVLYDFSVGHSIPTRFDGPAWGRFARRYAPYALVLLAYGLLRWMVLGSVTAVPTSRLDNPLGHMEPYMRFLNVVKVAGQYLWLCLWPASLSADYSYNAIPLADSLSDPGFLWGLLAWGGLLALALRSCLGKGLACFCVGFVLITFFPTSNTIIVIGTIMGERLFYLPSAGLCLLLAAGYDHVARRNRTMGVAALAIVSVVCLGLLVRTIVRNGDWVDTEHMARSAVLVVPNDAKIHSILGRLAKDKGRWDEALEHFGTALTIYPEYAQIDVTINSNLGISLIEKGLVTEGTEALERAARLDPQWSLLQYNLGFAYARQGRDQEAEEAYRHALRLNDEDPKAYTGLGYLYIKTHRYSDALASADAALLRDPSYIEALYIRARSLQALGQPEQAAEALQHILLLDPTRESIRGELRDLRRQSQPGRPAP